MSQIPVSAWNLRSAAMLVKLLALAPGFRLRREQVVGALWPDSDPEAALRAFAASLPGALTRSGRGLQDSHVLVVALHGPDGAILGGCRALSDAGAAD